MNDWTDEWPDVPGWYWFWGQPWPSLRDPLPPQLYSVTVHLGAVGNVVYVADGAFMYKDGGGRGLWFPAILPDLPED